MVNLRQHQKRSKPLHLNRIRPLVPLLSLVPPFASLKSWVQAKAIQPRWNHASARVSDFHIEDLICSMLVHLLLYAVASTAQNVFLSIVNVACSVMA